MEFLRPHGIIPDPFTAFKEDYSLDEATQSSYLRWLTQFPAIEITSVAGGGGEGHALTFEEFVRCVEIAVEVCHPRVKVMPNIGGESYEKVVQKIEAARNAGADAVRIVHPYYSFYTPSNLYQYYVDIAKAFPDLPILIYPQVVHTGRPFPVEILAKLADVDNIIGAKLSASSLSGYSFWDLFKLDMLTKGRDFLLIPGTLKCFYYFCRAGIQSEASIDGPLVQLAPAVAQSYFIACQAGLWDEAWAGLQVLEEISQGTTPAPGGMNRPASWKYASALLGRPVGPARRPCSMPTPQEATTIRSTLVATGLLTTQEAVAV